MVSQKMRRLMMQKTETRLASRSAAAIRLRFVLVAFFQY